MKWLLVIIIANTPVPTNLVFDTIEDCMIAEARYRTAVIDMANRDIQAFSNSPQGKASSESEKDSAHQFFVKRVGYGACVPHAAGKR